MAFEGFTEREQRLLTGALARCKAKFGSAGLKIDQPIDPNLGWVPTFFIVCSPGVVQAFEYSDKLYPLIFSTKAQDIRQNPRLIAVYQVCPLSTYQGDRHQTQTRRLGDHGFGIITVDDDGKNVDFPLRAVPLALHISDAEFAIEVGGCKPNLRRALADALDVYRRKQPQGVQDAGQIVEAYIRDIAAGYVKLSLITGRQAKAKISEVIDTLYGLPQSAAIRATLGAARNFVHTYRNPTSHAPATKREALNRIRSSRAAFLDACHTSRDLLRAARSMGIKLRTL